MSNDPKLSRAARDLLAANRAIGSATAAMALCLDGAVAPEALDVIVLEVKHLQDTLLPLLKRQLNNLLPLEGEA